MQFWMCGLLLILQSWVWSHEFVQLNILKPPSQFRQNSQQTLWWTRLAKNVIVKSAEQSLYLEADCWPHFNFVLVLSVVTFEFYRFRLELCCLRLLLFYFYLNELFPGKRSAQSDVCPCHRWAVSVWRWYQGLSFQWKVIILTDILKVCFWNFEFSWWSHMCHDKRGNWSNVCLIDSDRGEDNCETRALCNSTLALLDIFKAWSFYSLLMADMRKLRNS